MATWEEAVQTYRRMPGNEQAILDNYFDLPVLNAASRYARSDEFAFALRVIGQYDDHRLLEIGAGHGIASYAFARCGWDVTALEPDPSAEVGCGAIRQIVAVTNLPITVVEDWGEHLPFPDSSFSVVFGRQVLHHAHDLSRMVREVARVLHHGGRALFIRDHVVDNNHQKAQFLAAHPLHNMYGGENAFSAAEYRTAIRCAGLAIVREWGPLDSILNYYPGTERSRRVRVAMRTILCGANMLTPWLPRLHERVDSYAMAADRAPGRLVSILAEKPCA